MNNIEYMDKLKNRLKSYFDIYENKMFSDINFDIYAEYNERSSSYLFTQKAEIYAFETHEYILYKELDKPLDKLELEKYKNLVSNNIKNIVKLNEEHMSSIITLVFSCLENPDSEIIKGIRKFHYYKSFSFGFRGWVNVKLYYVNPLTKDIYFNKYGRRGKGNFLFTEEQ